MSYILDALKKAENERKTGTAQEHQPIPPFLGLHADSRESRRKLWWWVLVMALIGSVAGFAWTVWRQPSPPPPQAAHPLPPPVAKADFSPVPLPSPAPSVTPSKEHTAVHPATRTVVKPKPRKPPPAAPAAPKREERLATLEDLPAAVRERLPSLAAGGYLYSPNPADRSVLINKRLLHEGDRIVPGLTLEKLLPDGMVLNYEGRRFRTGY